MPGSASRSPLHLHSTFFCERCWSFGDFWKDALSVLMARERARIGLAASKGDWPRRIAEYARDDQEDAAAYAANY